MRHTVQSCTFDEAEVTAMLEAAPSSWWAAFIALAVSSGLRVSEQLRLHWSDVNSTTGTIRVTADPIVVADSPEVVSLRVPIPPSHERYVSVDRNLLAMLDAIRINQQHPSVHVFVPDWRVEQLWPRIVSHSPLAADALVPGIAEHFSAVQRMARFTLASERKTQLDQLNWPLRPLAALRHTYACRMAERVSPRELKTLLGYASVHSVLASYDRGVLAVIGGES